MAFFRAAGKGGLASGKAPPKLLDQVRHRMRRLGMARRSEEAYVGWIRRFILFNDKRHPADLGTLEVEGFLTSLAVQGNVSVSTQNQALSALRKPRPECIFERQPLADHCPSILPGGATAELRKSCARSWSIALAKANSCLVFCIRSAPVAIRLPVKYLVDALAEHMGDAEGGVERGRVATLLDRGDGLAGQAHALA